MVNQRAKDPAHHVRRMARKKKVVDERMARAQKDQGVLLVLDGNGKGKSSSGFGMVARALGHGMQVGIVQFIKGKFRTGEETFFSELPGVDYHVMGRGYTWETRDRAQDIEAAEAAWQEAARMLTDDRYGLILLDELNIVLRNEYLDTDQVLDTLQNRPSMQHVIVTGRNAPRELIELADTVTEMQVVKHAFRDSGIRAQKGVEL